MCLCVRVCACTVVLAPATPPSLACPSPSTCRTPQSFLQQVPAEAAAPPASPAHAEAEAFARQHGLASVRGLSADGHTALHIAIEQLRLGSDTAASQALSLVEVLPTEMLDRSVSSSLSHAALRSLNSPSHNPTCWGLGCLGLVRARALRVQLSGSSAQGPILAGLGKGSGPKVSSPAPRHGPGPPPKV